MRVPHARKIPWNMRRPPATALATQGKHCANLQVNCSATGAEDNSSILASCFEARNYSRAAPSQIRMSTELSTAN